MTSLISFSDLSIASFDDASFASSFGEAFNRQMAIAANVAPTAVIITKVEDGSVRVTSSVLFQSQNVLSADQFAAVVREDVASIFSEAEFQEYGDITSLDVIVHDSHMTDSPTSVPSLAAASSVPTRSPTDGGGDHQEDEVPAGTRQREEMPAGTLAAIVICCAIGLVLAALLASRCRNSRVWRTLWERNRGIRRLGAKVKRKLRGQIGKPMNNITTHTVVANPMVYHGIKASNTRNTDIEMSTPVAR